MLHIYIYPKTQADKEQAVFLTVPNSKCVDQEIENFLSSGALVINSWKKCKVVNLPRQVFDVQTVKFPETPLWFTLDANARGSLKASARGAQINADLI